MVKRKVERDAFCKLIRPNKQSLLWHIFALVVFFFKGKFHDFTNWPSFWSDLACWDFSTFFCSGWKCNANLSTFTIICQVTGRCFGNKLSLEFTKQKPSRRKHNALTKHLSKENVDSNPCMNLLAGDGFFLGPLCRTPRLLWF